MCRKLVFLISFVVASILVNSATAGVSVHFSFDGSQGADLPASVQDDTGSVTFQKVIDTHPSGSIGSLTYGEPNPFYNRGGTSANFVHASTLWRDVVEGPDILDLNDVEYTVEMFIKVNDWANDREQQVIFKKYTSDYVVEVLDAGSLRYSHAGEGAAGTIVTDPCVISLGQWYHIAFVFDSADTVTPQKIYIDGTQAASGGTTDLNPGSDEPVGIAAMTRPEYTRKDWLAANIDEFRISDEALAPSEFLLNQTFDPRFASRPSPGTGAENFCDGAELCWQPGLYAAEHDVYLGTDFNDVNDAVTTSGVYEGPQGPNCFTTSGLQPGTTYYWRIDEVNDVCSPYLWKGDVWNFTTNDGTAYDPEPSDGETKVPFDVVLGWTGGCLAVSHDVYFGTDVDAVSDATTDVHPDVEYDNVGSPSYDPTTEFDYLTVYYWRVDEVGPSSQRWKGTVWSLRSVSAIVDPNMIIWYKLDESEGETANDDSGYENHAHVDGPDEGPAWDPAEGRYGGSLGFDDDTDVEVPIGAMGSVSTGITVSLWLKDAYRSGSYNWVFEAPGPGGVRVQAAVVEEDNDDVYWRAGNDTNDVLTWDMAREDLDPKTLEGWHHWAFIKDEVAGAMSIYFDGEVKESNDVVDSTVANIRNGQMRFGVGGGSANTYIGKIDEVKVFNKALTAKEVAALFRGGELELAWAPQPIDNAKDVPRDVLLEWRPGDFADQHDVYFGTAFDDVNDAGTANTSIYKGRRALDANSYDPPGELDLETTYYWRIDEVNSSDPNVWKGKVWRFTVANFLIVDDMESYNAIPGSGNEVFDTWDDGFMNWTGSQIALEYSGGTTHGGEQSMKVQYDNAIAYYKYSEVDANTTGPRPGNLDIGVDWTILGVEALTVFFYGTPGNDANEQMYVALTDNSNNMAISRYGDMGEDMNDVREDDWHQWDMALSDFDSGGVDLNDVNKVRIGFGDRDNPVAGGLGIVFFDDIRLYLPKCVPWIQKPAMDFSNNCIVDFADVAMMAEDWLLSDIDVTPVTAPSAAVLHYAFEDASGSSVTDSAGSYTGTFFTDITTAPADVGPRVDADGKSGNSFHFTSPPASLGYGGIKMPSTVFTDNGISQEITISVWIKNVHPDDEPDGGAFMWEFRQWDMVSEDANDRVLGVETEDNGDTYVFRDQSESVSYEMDWERHTGWKHYAFVRNDSNLAIYVNGVLEEISDSNGTALATPQLLYLGITADRSPTSTDDMHDGFTGNVDEWKIFDYALSLAELGHVTSDGTGVVLMDSAYNIHDTESAGSRAINFRDYALLMESWLEKIYWP